MGQVTRDTCILAAILLLGFARAAALPVSGAWEGKIDGRRAVTLEVRDVPNLHGSITLYIVHDEENREHDGDATPALALDGPAWDGDVLQFSITAGEGRLAFEMRPAAAGKTVLRRLATRGLPELTIALSGVR